MNDMINYLTTKNRLLVAILAFILPFLKSATIIQYTIKGRFMSR